MAAPNAMPIRDDLQEGISYLVSRKVTNNEYAGLRDAARQKYIGAGMCPAAAEKPSGAAIDEASLAAPVFISFTFTTLGWIMAMLGGQGVFAKLKFESGVHRVQRVPTTEASGRIHTSTVTVAVLPEAEEVDVEIDPNDLDVDVYRSSGPGGQSVNTTDSAVRLTHKPTGLVVTCQDEKSQHKNKAKAMKVLRSRLLDLRIAEEQAKYAAERKSQVGTGERNERIRTYNYPQNRVTDHRIELTLHSLPKFMEGEIEDMVVPLGQHDLEEKLAAIQAE